MIAWSIEAAHQAECFDQIVVSTDDPEIASVARSWGAQVPFLRPAQLAHDFVATAPVVAHALQFQREAGWPLDAVCCLYATAPFVQPAELDQGRALLEQVGHHQFVFTATSYAAPIQRALRLNEQTGLVAMWNPDQFNTRTQDLQPAYHDAGQFYWGRPEAWISVDDLFESARPLLLPRWRVHDIDTEDDWIRAEMMHEVWARD